EALEGFARLKQFYALLIFLGAERHGDQGLGLAPGEDRRAVSTGKNASLGPDRPDFVESAAVRTAMPIQHFVAEDPLFQRVEKLTGLFFLLFRRFLDRAIMERIYARIAFELWIFLRIESIRQFHTDLF